MIYFLTPHRFRLPQRFRTNAIMVREASKRFPTIKGQVIQPHSAGTPTSSTVRPELLG